MATIDIDINTPIWGADQRIFVLFPGRAYSFFTDFQARSIVYLDVPGLELPAGRRTSELNDYAGRLMISDRIRAWHRNRRETPEPSRDLVEYATAKIGPTRAVLAGQVNTLYQDIKRGDLIIVPGGAPYYSDVQFGEIADDPGQASYVSVRQYPGERVLARRIRWIAQAPKYRLSYDFASRLQSPNPLIGLSRKLWDEALSISFDNYVLNGDFSARFQTTREEFSSIDSATISSFLTIVAAATALAETGDQVEDGALTFEKALEVLTRHPEYSPDLRINIRSPGDIAQRNSYIGPLVAAAMLAAALAFPAAAAPADIHVDNSKGKGDACAVLVNERVKQTINMMGYERWQVQCRLLKAAHDRTGLKTPSRAKVLP